MADLPDKPQVDTVPGKPQLGRRLLVLRVASAGAAATALTAGVAEAAGPRVGDPEPALRATPVVTDNDPSDAPGYGRGYYRPPPPRYYAPPRVTDNDPYDAAGRGRGGYYYAPPPRRSVTDSDPYDAAGRGRGWR